MIGDKVREENEELFNRFMEEAKKNDWWMEEKTPVMCKKNSHIQLASLSNNKDLHISYR